MSKEYGIDPEAINTYDSFFRIVPLFGPEYFRFIRRYPKKWPNLVIKATEGQPEIARTRIIEKLRLIKKELSACNSIPEYDGNHNWIVNALVYHNTYPFDGVISNQNPNSDSFICNSEDFDTGHRLFDNTSCIIVERTPIKMAESVGNLLRNGSEIHFIDPHFENLHQKYLRPFVEFVNTIASRSSSLESIKIVYHTGDEVQTGFEQSFDTNLKPILPKGLNLKIIRWPKLQMHNRYILTNIGGVTLGIGLDDSNGGPRTEDTITGLSAKQCLLIACGNKCYMDDNCEIFHTVIGEKI